MRPRILLADDDPVALNILEDRFQALGYEVETATNGVEAVERARRGHVDLVILDVTIPSLNGYQACQRLKTDGLGSTLPVVLLSAGENESSRFWGEEVRADLYLSKQLGAEHIVDSVRKLIA